VTARSLRTKGVRLRSKFVPHYYNNNQQSNLTKRTFYHSATREMLDIHQYDMQVEETNNNIGLTIVYSPKVENTLVPADGESFLMEEEAVRFYPYKIENARENEAVSVIYSRKLELLGPKPKHFSVTPSFYEIMPMGKQIIKIDVGIGTHFYGGGENAVGLCLNNNSFITWNMDAFDYQKSDANLYQSHPYVMAVRADGTSFGVIADTTYPLKFSMTDTDMRIENWGRFDKSWHWNETTNIKMAHPFSITVFEGNSPHEVVEKLAKLTGYMPLPPKWSLGYHQCRWSYYPDTEALRIAKTMREKNYLVTLFGLISTT